MLVASSQSGPDLISWQLFQNFLASRRKICTNELSMWAVCSLYQIYWSFSLLLLRVSLTVLSGALFFNTGQLWIWWSHNTNISSQDKWNTCILLVLHQNIDCDWLILYLFLICFYPSVCLLRCSFGYLCTNVYWSICISVCVSHVASIRKLNFWAGQTLRLYRRTVILLMKQRDR